MNEMAMCFIHPERAAVEHCEVCQRPVCGSCLWYAASGERLCRVHGEWWREQGKTVTEGQPYDNAIVFSELQAWTDQRDASTQKAARYRGNSPDFFAVLALLAAIMLCGSFSGCSYFTPCAGVVFGALALSDLKSAYDPHRTRRLAYIAIAINGLIAITVLGTIVAIIIMFILNN
jgi:hypothetical protein